MEKSSFIPKLPELLILEILTLLPVKSLCRFRCVSKTWLALIGHPKFVKLHLSKTQQRHGLVFPGKSLYIANPETLSCPNKFVVVKDQFLRSILDCDYCLSIVGSCNGLLCFKLPYSLFFYNPSTKEYKRIHDFRSRYFRYGLGYAESTDDYKYVKIYDDVKSNIWVYSLKRDSWIGIQSDFQVLSYLGIPLNGALHWLVYDGVSPNQVIAAFNLVEEKFKTLPVPEIMIESDNNNCDCSFGLLGGCLCLFIEEEYHTLQLWIMKEYGVKESWTKILTAKGHRYLQPLCYLNNIKTIFANIDFEQVLFWDSKDSKFKNVEVEGIEDIDNIPCVYVESLVSPHYRNDFANEEENLLAGYWLD